MFVPEILLPEQYFDRCAARANETPEKRLMFAILLDAVLQLHSGDTKNAAEAERWIRDRENVDEPFSFWNICEVLEIEPSYFARGLIAKRNEAQPRLRLRQARVAFNHIAPPRPTRRRASRSRLVPRQPAAKRRGARVAQSGS
jgi:hypothetical protein